MSDTKKIVMCENCINNINNKCKYSGEYVSWNEYCEEGDDGDNEGEGYDI